MRAPIWKPPGSTAPGSASGTLSPALKLTAPQITWWSAAPAVTRQYRIGLANSVSSSTSRTWATTMPVMSWPTCSTVSTSSPAAVRRRATSAGVDVGTGLERHVLKQPGQRDPHHASIPNARLNRTSPSTASLMSVRPCLIIRVRSMPSPKAKPL